MQREPLESSSLRSLGYDPTTNTLEVEFKSGRIYRYLGVPPTEYAALRNARSIGGYFTRQIRNNYECWRLVRAGT
jgi:hypothetical protein